MFFVSSPEYINMSRKPLFAKTIRFSPKKVGLISTFLFFTLLISLPRIMVRGDFGSIVTSANTNSQLDGSNNTGKFKENTNCKFQGSNNSLNVIQNTNCQLSGDESNISLERATNTKIKGQRNHLTVQKETNGRLTGNDNTCTLASNTNVRIEGHDNEATLERNTNAQLMGDSNKVTASENTRLEILGNKNDVSAVGTVNHCLKKVEPGSLRNKLTILPLQGSSSGSSIFGGSLFGWSSPAPTIMMNGIAAKVKFMVDYVSQIQIERTDYNVGIFKFKMEEVHEPRHLVRASFNPTDYDQDTLRGQLEHGDKYTVKGSKDGRAETLEICGSKIRDSLAAGSGQLTVEIGEPLSKV